MIGTWLIVVLWGSPVGVAGALAVSDGVRPVDMLERAHGKRLDRVRNQLAAEVFAADQPLRAPAWARQVEGIPIYAVEARIDDLPTPRVEADLVVSFVFHGERPTSRVVMRMIGAGDRREGAGMVVEGRLDGRRVDLSVVGTVVELQSKSLILPGQTVSVRLRTVQVVPDLSHPLPARAGMNVEDFGAYGHDDGVVNLGYFLPQLAAWRPGAGWDDRPLPGNGEHVLAEASHWLVTVDAPAALVIASSGGELRHSGILEGGRQRRVFGASAAREFSAVASRHFVVHEREVMGTRFRAFLDSRKSRHDRQELTREILDHAAYAHNWYSRVFGRLPWREFDVVIAPGAVAMGTEFSGLVTLNLEEIAAADGRIGMTVAHEIGHQWWYAGVGNDARAEPWVDEALTSWSSALYWGYHHGGNARQEALFASEYASALAADPHPLPADLPAGSYRIEEYGAAVYGRGAMFFETIAEELGVETVTAAIATYFEANAGKVADGDTLREALRTGTGRPDVVDRAWSLWIATRTPNGSE